MAEQYQVMISPRASRQLIAYVEFLSRRSINTASRLSAEYKTVIQALKKIPFSFRLIPIQTWKTHPVSHCLPSGIRSTLILMANVFMWGQCGTAARLPAVIEDRAYGRWVWSSDILI